MNNREKHFSTHACRVRDDYRIMFRTLEGDMYGDIGDWIIKGVTGELYPCKDDIFRQTYDILEVQ
jgi:hypothetical protein